MTNKSTLLLSAAALAMAGGTASANALDNTTLSFGYESYQGENAAGDTVDRTGTWGRAETSLKFGGPDFRGIEIDLGATYGNIKEDDANLTLSVAPKLDFRDGLKLGAFYDHTMIDSGDVMHYGAVVEYDLGDLDVSGFIGRGDYDGETSDVYGATVTYDVAGAFELGAFYTAESLSNEDYTEMGATIGYNMSLFSVPGKVTATYGIQDVDGAELDRVSVAYSIPLGQSGKVRNGAPAAHKHSIKTARGFTTPK